MNTILLAEIFRKQHNTLKEGLRATINQLLSAMSRDNILAVEQEIRKTLVIYYDGKYRVDHMKYSEDREQWILQCYSGTGDYKAHYKAIRLPELSYTELLSVLESIETVLSLPSKSGE